MSKPHFFVSKRTGKEGKEGKTGGLEKCGQDFKSSVEVMLV